MRIVLAVVTAALQGALPSASADVAIDDRAYVEQIQEWRAKAEQRLRRDLGWLTIAGRWELPPGRSTIGSAPGNDIVLPTALAPAKLGTLEVEPDFVTLVLAPGLRMWTEPEPGKRGEAFTERTLVTRGNVEWVTSGRLSFYVFTRGDGKAVLRIADRESRHRAQFAGRRWFDVQPRMRLTARFNPYPPGTKIPVANVRGEISEEDAAGNVEFELEGRIQKLDVFAEQDGSLFIILRDGTSGATTYPPGRFLVTEPPVDGRTVLDFNKAYNPPCAFSAYTTCPLPPPQNWIKAKIEAGERYLSTKEAASRG